MKMKPFAALGATLFRGCQTGGGAQASPGYHPPESWGRDATLGYWDASRDRGPAYRT